MEGGGAQIRQVQKKTSHLDLAIHFHFMCWSWFCYCFIVLIFFSKTITKPTMVRAQSPSKNKDLPPLSSKRSVANSSLVNQKTFTFFHRFPPTTFCPMEKLMMMNRNKFAMWIMNEWFVFFPLLLILYYLHISMYIFMFVCWPFSMLREKDRRTKNEWIKMRRRRNMAVGPTGAADMFVSFFSLFWTSFFLSIPIFFVVLLKMLIAAAVICD